MTTDDANSGDERTRLALLEKEVEFTKIRLDEFKSSISEKIEAVQKQTFKKVDIARYLAIGGGTVAAFFAWFAVDIASIQNTIKDKVNEAINAYYSSDIKANISKMMDDKFEAVKPTLISDDTIRTTIAGQVTSVVTQEIKKQSSIIQSASANQVDLEFKSLLGSTFKAQLARLSDAAKNFVIDSNYFLCGPGNRPRNPKAKDLFDDAAIIYTKEIKFEKTFTRPPSVIVSLNSIHGVTTKGDLAIWLNADPITANGFTFTMKSLMDNVTNCKIHWVAIDQFSAQQVTTSASSK
jgi:hypothetical protein